MPPFSFIGIEGYFMLDRAILLELPLDVTIADSRRSSLLCLNDASLRGIVRKLIIFGLTEGIGRLL